MFRPIESNESVYKKIVRQIQDMIMSGELKKGDRLPPERQLAEIMGVGRPALKQAISALEVLGIIKSRQGDGNYITADSVEVISPIGMQFYLENGNADDVLEFRYIMEVQMAALAAEKITKEQAAKLGELMEEIRRELGEGADLEKRKYYNNRFHFQLVNICGNRLISSIYGSIMDLVADQISHTDGSRFYESHRKIFDAICDRDPERAARCMAEHFQNKFPNYRYYMDYMGIH